MASSLMRLASVGLINCSKTSKSSRLQSFLFSTLMVEYSASSLSKVRTTRYRGRICCQDRFFSTASSNNQDQSNWLQLLMLNPYEREDTTLRDSKSKSKTNNILVPLTIRQIAKLTSKEEDLESLGRVVLVGRIIKLKELVGRTMVTLCDETGTINIVEGQGGADLEEEKYYRFVVVIKTDKDQAVLYSQRNDRVHDFNQIQHHFANVMLIAEKIPFYMP